MTWWLPLAAIPVGALLGLLGGGGAILTVPVLTTGLGQTPIAATTGSLVIVGAGALVGLAAHLRTRRVHVADGLTFGTLGLLGSAAGSRLSASVSGPVLMTAFAALLLVAAGAMWRSGNRHTTGPGPRRGWAVQIAAATTVGLLTGFFGVGGGFVIVPALVLALGLTLPEAAATSLLVIAVNCATSLTARVVGGVDVDWGVVLPFAALVVVGTFVGARLSARIDAARLRTAFISLLVVVAAVVAAQNVPHLA